MSPLFRSLTVVIALAALATGAYTAFRMRSLADGTPPDIDATIFSSVRPVPPFELIDHDGAAFTPERLRGHWTLIFFGFTHCPDVCPTTLHTLARSSALLEDLPPGRQPEIILVSVDPERDTVGKLREYVPFFDPSFLGVTGNPKEIDALTAALGVAHRKIYRDDGEYTVDHSAAIFLIDRNGNQAALFSPPHEAETLARNYQMTIAYLERQR